MDRETFAEHFRRASVAARDFARNYIEEELPDDMRFRLRLNCSYDVNATDEDTLYPDDSSPERAKALRECTAEAVVDTLWRGGEVPQWADLQVIGRTEDASLLQVMVCGRFTANHERLYHVQEGHPPFHATGPWLPVRYEDGKRFSLYDRSECWDERDLGLLAPHTDKVWSLELHGNEIVDSFLHKLPSFSKLELLELRATRVAGPGLAALGRHPNLRVFRAHILEGQPFHLSSLPTQRAMRTLDLNGLPSFDWGASLLAGKVPRVEHLSLRAFDTLLLDGSFPPADELSLEAVRIDGEPTLPSRLRRLGLHFAEFSDAICDQLLAPVSSLQSLSLRGSPVSVEQLGRLVRKFELEHLDAVDCGLSRDAALKLRADFPQLRMLPDYKASTP